MVELPQGVLASSSSLSRMSQSRLNGGSVHASVYQAFFEMTSLLRMAVPRALGALNTVKPA